MTDDTRSKYHAAGDHDKLALMNVADLLAQHGIRLPNTAPGEYAVPCPRCSAKRKPQHQKCKCLGVKIDADGACWRCNHCDWSGPEKGTGNGKAATIEATHDYVEGGEFRFQKVRYPRIGLPATCNFDGTSDATKNSKAKPKWKPAYSETLRGADIVILNDNDPPGYAHADTIARMSVGICQRVRRLDLAPHWPDIPKGGDISDWLARGHTREELDALIAQAPDYAVAGTPGAAPQQPSPNAVELKDMTFQPIKYVVPGIIVEGLTLLTGKPKIGKSWLLLHAAIAVARGGFTLGDIHCIEGDVLYCALEDNLRRLQSRMTMLLGMTQSWPERLRFKCEMPRLTEGGLDVIKDWIASVAHPRLIIIDTLAMVKAPTKQKEQTQYDADYGVVLELRTLANKHGLAIVAVHHLRKADADDAFDTVSGTLGLTGAVDTVLILKRDTSGTIVMHGRGRDLIDVEKAMSFDINTCIWRIEGDAADIRRSAERQAVLNAIAEAAEPIGPRDIATMTGMRTTNVRFLLGKLAKEGAIEKASYGKYRSCGA